ncbi:MAG TPA: AtpZ/AtpI family protein [Thermomicrobiales bacterium]|nr:AtpZ/AtpI family protein [Thermomicrobiales bacterium]
MRGGAQLENPLGGTRRDWQAVGAASGIGCTVVVSLLLCIGGGILLDRWLETSPIFTLSGMMLGLMAAGYSLYELAVLGSPARGVVKLRKDRPAQSSDGENGSRPCQGDGAT